MGRQAKDRPRLRIVDDQGEVHEGECPNCAGAEKEVRAWRVRYANLKRDVEATWTQHDLFPDAKRLFDFWRVQCRHPRAKFTPERFDQCRPHLRDEGIEICKRAIEGAAYDPFITTRANGTTNRHDAWSLIFRSREKLEEFANRAPYHLPNPDHLKTLANALVFLEPKLELHDAVAEARRRLMR